MRLGIQWAPHKYRGPAIRRPSSSWACSCRMWRGSEGSRSPARGGGRLWSCLTTGCHGAVS
eukprot:4759890-Prymnesium_polylepis.1